MNKIELVRRVASEMRESNIRKPISVPKQVFHISDDEGNSKDFILRRVDKKVLYTVDDVEAIVDTCIAVIEDALAHGEPVSLRGFGTFALKYRKARATNSLDTGERIDIDARYVPKFSFGHRLKMCAKLFELSLDDASAEPRTFDLSEDGDD